MTINLTQAQKLQELGVDKYAEKSWWSNPVQTDEPFLDSCNADVDACYLIHIAQAYNAEELIKLLRAKEHTGVDIYSHGDGFMFHNEGSEIAGQDDIYGDSLTECLANELIYMLENEIITAEEINGNSI